MLQCIDRFGKEAAQKQTSFITEFTAPSLNTKQINIEYSDIS